MKEMRKMKTRIDFVSNSSSCSFVVAVSSSLHLNDFVKVACDGCLKHADDEYAMFVTSQNELNKISLNYHLRMSEMLYLGGLDVGKFQITVAKDDNDAYFKYLKKRIANSVDINGEVVEDTDERIVLERDDVVNGMAIDSHKIDSITIEYHVKDDYSKDIDKQKLAAKGIFNFAKSYSDKNTSYLCREDHSTCFISRKTIWNTQALIAAGYKVELNAWMDLDKLEQMLQNGDKLFIIHVNNGGDGVQTDALYTFGGWDGEDIFDDIQGVEVLDSETM
jgi:hypothetical protein